jgi:hypothetical protein
MNTTPTALRRLALLTAVVAGLAAPPAASAYGWPVKPFHEQHPVRAFFGDPRIGTTSRSLHFGIDVVAPNGAPVYATQDGRVWIEPGHNRSVVVRGDTGRNFSYWHVVPVVHTGDRVSAYRSVIGHVERPWAHVHFAEVRDHCYLNPLRPGAMAPFVDRTRPEVGPLTAERAGKPIAISKLSGLVTLVADVRDWMPVAAPAPWTGKPVMPALDRWRMVGARGRAGRWHTALDLRDRLPDCGYAGVFAKWTRQNKPWRSGRYRIYLSRGLDTRRYADGAYPVEVQAVDTAGNVASATHPVTIRNAA